MSFILSPRKALKAVNERVFKKSVEKIFNLFIGTFEILNGIKDGILNNDLNRKTIEFIWKDFFNLASFLVDLVECAKCYTSAASLDGNAGEKRNAHGHHNELDFALPMCRHAVLCQAQRLAKSLITILGNAMKAKSFADIDMTNETRLDSDDYGNVGDSGVVIQVRPSGRQRMIHPPQDSPWSEEESEETCKEEKWLFVNGIATELFWLHLACKKLASQYNREITGIFNRSEGVFWDLIECAGERNMKGQWKMTERTKSSLMAQKSLENQVRAALGDAREKDLYKRIVVVAHSQGCLVLRLALDNLSKTDHKLEDTMKKRLCIFTFGNPSAEWTFDKALRTEHFANKEDFVAKLGVICKSEGIHAKSGYKNGPVFINSEKDWKGHLFGTQYSLNWRDYDKGTQSWLLMTKPGQPLSNPNDASGEKPPDNSARRDSAHGGQEMES